MEPLETIDKVFARNLREMRGDKRQEDVAHESKVPWRSYVRLEKGTIPRNRAHLKRLATYYGVTETRFFLDPDLATKQPATDLSVEKALEVLRRALETSTVERRIGEILRKIDQTKVNDFIAAIDSLADGYIHRDAKLGKKTGNSA
jgi:transcriptional regulator with XRE-family HTH domain